MHRPPLLRRYSAPALAGAVLLHAIALALITHGFSPHSHELPRPAELAVVLIPAEQPRPAPAPAPAPPPRPEPKPQPKPAPAPRPVTPRPAPQPAPAAPAPVPAASAAPAAAAAEPAAAAAAPVRTGVMISASYVAGETEKWYPALSKRYDEQGTVLLRVYVSAAGRAERVEFRKRSDYPLLDDAAVGLANSLKYNPAQLDGKPVADWIDLPVVFKLRNR